MKLSKSEINYLLQAFFCFAFLNVTLNMLGLWFAKLLNSSEFAYLDSIKYEFVKPMLIQSVLFGVLLTVGFFFIKKRVLAHYLFSAFQFLSFHVIFFINLHFKGGLHFASTFKNIGLQYLSNSGQYLIDILYLYFPINGNFENGLFMPSNTGTFYIHWILLTALYYAGLTWLTAKTVKWFFGKPAVKAEKVEE